MLRIQDTLYNIYDRYTGEEVSYNKTTTWIDGSPMSDLHCDGTIFRKLGNEYFKRNYSGPVNPRWWGADPEGVIDSTPAFQAAIDAFQTGSAVDSGVDILIPRGTYLLANLIVKTGTKLYANQMAKDNFIANVPVTIKAFGNPDYIIDTENINTSNYSINNLYIDCDADNQPQLIAGVRLKGHKCYFTGNNVNRAANVAVWNECGLIYIEKNGIYGWYGNTLPTFTGINDFRGALHCPAMGDSYIYDNEIGAGLSYFTSTVVPRDPTNGRIVALSLGSIFGGTSVISGNLFENGDRAVAIGNSLYCNFTNNRYELSAMGGLYIYGPMQFATFSQERFADNSLSVDGGADDITIAIGAAGNIAFIAPTFESLANVSIPNSSFKVNYHISNYGSDLVDLVTPVVDPTYSVNGLVNLSDVTNLPVRQVKGQYDPDNPRFDSVSTQLLPAETPQLGYVKLKQGTDEDNSSLVGAVEFWTPQNTLAYSIGFSPKEYLSISGYEVNPIFALNGDIALQKQGEAKCTIWSTDAVGDSKIVLQGGGLVTSQATITLNNTTEDLTVIASNDIVFGVNENLRLQNNGTTLIPFTPSPDVLANVSLLARNTDSGEMVIIDAATVVPTLDQVTTKGNQSSRDIIILGPAINESSQIQIGNFATSSVSTLQAGYNPIANEGISALLLQGEDRNEIIISQHDLEFILDNNIPVATLHVDGRMTGAAATGSNDFVTLSQSQAGFIQNGVVTPQNAGYYIQKPSKIEYLNDTDGNIFGTLEVYRTIENPDYKSPQNIRSVFRVYSNEAGHEDKELTSLYGGLHITAANTGNYTNATEGLIAVAGTASTLGGSGNITLMSCFGALGGNAPTGSAVIDRFAFFKVTSYDQNLNTGKVTKIAGFAQPKLSIPGATGAIQWFSGMGDATTSGGMLGNQVWPTGNWNMYDASGYANYFSGTTLIATLTDDTTSKLQVGGTTRTPVIVGGTTITDTLSLQNYTSGTTGAIIDQYGITVGGGTASTNTLFKATRAFTNPTGNVHGFRAEQSAVYTTAPTANSMFGGFFVPTIGAANTQNWTSATAIQGISVAPTITNGATGTLGGVVVATFDLNLRAAGVTVTNAMGIRVYVDPLTTSPMTNVTLLGIGTSTTVTGNWSIYNAETYKSYLGTGAVLLNTTTDSGTGAKLQVNGTIESTATRVGGVTISTGAGSPEGSVTAPTGSLYLRTTGGANTTLYVKESGAGNTGWIAK